MKTPHNFSLLNFYGWDTKQAVGSTVTTEFYLKVTSLCKNVFLAILQVSSATLYRHSAEIGRYFPVDKYKNCAVTHEKEQLLYKQS